MLENSVLATLEKQQLRDPESKSSEIKAPVGHLAQVGNCHVSFFTFLGNGIGYIMLYNSSGVLLVF